MIKYLRMADWMTIARSFCAAAVAAAAFMPSPAREFLHPGITYTQGDFDRMRAMVVAGREPWKSTFDALLRSPWASFDVTPPPVRTEIGPGQFNGTVGQWGRRAHDLALVWKLTGDERYAAKAVAILNANSHYTHTHQGGTAALDNGKINLLVEAAEMMRDYPGWAAEDQKRFKAMLRSPDCFLPAIFNFDCARFGNQGLFAARAMMAIGIYLDDDKLYERALRYLKGEKHREDDAPYRPGPPETGSPIGETEFQQEWRWSGRLGDEPDYQYDDQIAQYIKPNGQCQESSRDQAHTMCGLHLLVAIADIAWNQGDDLFSFADSRILLGLEWTYRYNLSAIASYPDQPAPWEPTGYTENEKEATFENGMFLQYLHRSRRWKSLKPTPDRGDTAKCGGTREAALAHYAIRAKMPEEKTLWLRRYRDYMIEKHGCENWGVAPNWFYEWTGWGTLAKRRTDWMRGDPRKTVGGKRVSGAHRIGESVRWTDSDFSPLADAAQEERMRSFTFAAEAESECDVAIAYTSLGDAQLAISVDKSKPVAVSLPKAPRRGKAVAKAVPFPAGASVMRIAIAKDAPGLKILGFQTLKKGE